MLAQGRDKPLRQRHDAILLALAVAHQDLVVIEIDIRHPQPQALHHPQAAAIEETGHQPSRAREGLDQPPRLRLRQHHRQALGAFCAREIAEVLRRLLQDLLV